jgi:hypothetical protein
MAKLVMGIGVPHTPFFPGIAKQQGDSSRMVGLFKRVRRELESANPDLIVMLTTDHFVSFFFDNMPTFCIGAFEHADSPHELSRMMQQYRSKPRSQTSAWISSAISRHRCPDSWYACASSSLATRSNATQAMTFRTFAAFELMITA